MPFPPAVSPPGPAGAGAAPAVAPVVGSPRPKFPKDTTGFHAELRRRVADYFRAGRSERDCWQMYLKSAVILATLATSYVLLVFFARTWWQAVPLAVVVAWSVGAVAFNIQHDGGHHAYSRRPWVNTLATLSLDLIGASSYVWRWKHTVIHHTYTNVDGVDTDIDPGDIARLSPHRPWRWFHRWQHLYLWPLYAVTSSRWHLYGDFKDVVAGKMGPHPIPRPRGRDLAVFLGGKAFSVGWFLVLPMVFHPWWVVLLYYFFVTGVVGVTITTVFQLAHCVGEADYPLPEGGEPPRMTDAWAVHQVVTTVNFARRSRLACWLLGGLNFQVEHHLFPQVCHVRYPALSRIVEEVCREYGVRYAVHDSLLAGLRAHYRWLRQLGRPEPATAA